MDSWIILGPLGNGCFDSVFLGISSEGLPLVVKSSSDIEKSRSLQKEKFILENFYGCPEIVHCYGGRFSIEEGLRKYNLVLEYASRGCLHDLMRKYGGKIPESDAAYYTKMILKGLYEIHEREFVHCDLTLENILVFPPEDIGNLSQLKIANFGSAEVLAEQKSALDVRSLGCVVAEMITGEKPRKEEAPNYLSEEGKDFLNKCFEGRWTANMLLKHPFLVKNT